MKQQSFEVTYTCEICFEKFATAKDLLDHSSTCKDINSNKAFSCDDCQKVFVTKSKLERHNATQKHLKVIKNKNDKDNGKALKFKKEVFTCNRCDKAFENKGT